MTSIPIFLMLSAPDLTQDDLTGLRLSLFLSLSSNIHSLDTFLLHKKNIPIEPQSFNFLHPESVMSLWCLQACFQPMVSNNDIVCQYATGTGTARADPPNRGIPQASAAQSRESSSHHSRVEHPETRGN